MKFKLQIKMLIQKKAQTTANGAQKWVVMYNVKISEFYSHVTILEQKIRENITNESYCSSN